MPGARICRSGLGYRLVVAGSQVGTRAGAVHRHSLDTALSVCASLLCFLSFGGSENSVSKSPWGVSGEGGEE